MFGITTPVVETIKTWMIVVMTAGIVMMGLWVSYLSLSVIPVLELEKKVLASEKQSCETLIRVQNNATEENAVDDHEVAQVPIRIEKIIRELVPVKEEIIKWRDSNETNCSVGMDKLYEFDFVGVWGKAFGAADRESTTESEDQNASSTQRPES